MYQSDFSNDSMKELYLFESTTLLDQLDDILLQSEQDEKLFESNVNEIFRIMHTIKGSSSMMSYDSISDTTHKLEDLFYYIRENGFDNDFGKSLFDLMLNASDYLKDEISKVQTDEELTYNKALSARVDELLSAMSTKKDAKEGKVSIPVPDLPFPESLQKKNIREREKKQDTDKKTDQDTLRNAVSSVMKTLSQDTHKYVLHVYFNEDAAMENVRAYMLSDKLTQIGTVTDMLPDKLKDNPEAADQIINDGYYIAVETSLPRRQIEETAKDTLSVESVTFVDEIPGSDETPGSNVSYPDKTPSAEDKDAEKKDPEKGSAAPHEQEIALNSGYTAKRSNAKSISRNFLNVDSEKIDKLMNIVGEVVTTEAVIIGNPEVKKINNDDFERTKRELRNVTNELKDTVMSIRMLPIGMVFSRMQRIVRDMNQSLGKDAELMIIGENTELDKTVMDHIIDPIIHLVRNAMDHGIETPEERIKAGKNAQGSIILSAQNVGGEILIYVRDDGAGIDTDGVLRKAAARGLLEKDPSEYTEDEIYSLLTLPGFSLQDSVTQYSGRGVGLDVVKNGIEEIGGNMRIQSTENGGTNIQIRIPLTIAIIPCILARVGESVYSISVSVVKETFSATKDMLKNDDHIEFRGNTYKYVSLSRLHGLTPVHEDPADGIFILIDTGKNNYCILVDEIIENRQIVVYPLPAYIANMKANSHGLTGCTILGDGSVSIILDMDEVFY